MERSISAQSAEAGEVIFAMANYGTLPHEFLVTKTSYDPGKIPLGSDLRFNEEDKGLSVVDEIPEWAVNESKVLKVTLEAGTYELLCNIEGHYGNGMHTSFTVVPAKVKISETTVPPATVVSNDISGSVKEWAVAVNASEAKAGDVTFTIKNEGSIPHEFIIVKTDFAPGKIPLGPDNRFDEEGKGVFVPGEISEWNPGTTGTVTLKLEPGNYQLLCNIAGHYANGMYTQLTVS
ncbi:MAG: sulfocyanin-like copper-binding protein [Actinobacteria bacterium]|nr:sulfocyanin-like copper-binding protein [Actinomycetota bacterium]